MKQFLLAICLIALPVGLFAGGERWLFPQIPDLAVAEAGPSLGDLGALMMITADTETIALKGDLSAAAARIKDLETAWDDAEMQMQPLNPTEWGVLDGLIDDSLSALRAAKPDAAGVAKSLAALQAELENPGATAIAGGGIQMVEGIAVTDGGGHALPCETMIADLRAALAGGALTDADAAAVTALEDKALERCNADDDSHADAFSAAALALVSK